MVATALVAVVVLFELLYVGSLSSCDEADLAFVLSLGVSAIFFVEIVLRYYNWQHSVKVLKAEDLEIKRAGVDPPKSDNFGIGDFLSNKVR